MRILFVAMPESIHATRWINQLAGQGWDIHLYPSTSGPICPELKEATVHDVVRPRHKNLSHKVVSRGLRWPFPCGRMPTGAFHRMMDHFLPNWRARRLAKVIRAIRPDIVHSLELQHSGYTTLRSRLHVPGKFPTWIATNWGSDIYLFRKLPYDDPYIRGIMQHCDYYSCECHRDVALAREMGLTAPAFPVFPNAGGYDLEKLRRLRQPGPTSARRLILIKGYQGWAGRALVGLHAIRLCAEHLKGYRIGIYLASPDVELAAQVLKFDTGLPIEILPYRSHEDMLRLHGQARVYIGLSISDGISTSLLEAMIMGAFPIQSSTACVDEWLECGKSGMIVPPEEPGAIAAAIRRAVTDDGLVDRAAEDNSRTADQKLAYEMIQPRVIQLYKDVLAGKKTFEDSVAP